MSIPSTSRDIATRADNVKLVQYAAELRRRFSPQKKILLIQAPQFLFESINLDVIRNRGCYAYPPTGLQWLAKSLEGRGLDIEILDMNFLLLDRIVQDPSFDYRNWLDLLDGQLAIRSPAIIGVSCLSVYADLLHTRHPLTEILRHLMQPEKYIVMAGGPTATNGLYDYLSNQFCHFIVEGEGENKINYLFDILFDESRGHRPVSGIYFNFNNKVAQTAGIRENVALAGNLVSTYPAIPVEAYHSVGSLNPYSRMAGQDKIYGTFQLVRGCRYNCKFCGVRAFMGKGLRVYPVGTLLEEIRYLVITRGVRHFEVLDDDFLAAPREAMQLLAGLRDLRRQYAVTWAANNGMVAASLTDELLTLMVHSGCLGFKIGFESANPSMLRKMRKPGSLKIFQRAGRLLEKYPELNIGGNYIIGLFGEETFGQMLDTFAFSGALRFDWSTFAVFQFTSRPNSETENLKAGNTGGATDFIPAKDMRSREVEEDKELSFGRDVFRLPKDYVPTRAEMSNIWFAFNLVANYINNKNLKPGGCPAKFVDWVKAVQAAYPSNPYMHLFVALGCVLLGKFNEAESHLKRGRSLVDLSPYWRARFRKFRLDELMASFPRSAGDVYARLDDLQSDYREYIQ